MAIYSASVRSVAAASGAAYATIHAAARRARIIELGAFTIAATASSLGLGHPGNTPVASTSVLGQAHYVGDAAAVVNVDSAWSTAPTVPSAFFKRATLAAAIGAGVVWRFPPGEEIILDNNAGSSQWLAIWNHGAAAGSILDVYATWEE